MTVGSLFAGIGGFDLGLERAGMSVRWQCESDKRCREVLRRQWPEPPIYPDIRTMSDAPAVDVVCGGFPCQDVSHANSRGREGLGGKRSGLWFEMLRVIRELRPQWVIAENVPGLLSSNGGRDFGTVLGGLAELGYGVAYRVLNSAGFGVPQRRRRVFIVGSLGDGRGAEILLEPESVPRDSTPRQRTQLPDTGVPALCPTLRSRFDGSPRVGDDLLIPRHARTLLRGEGRKHEPSSETLLAWTETPNLDVQEDICPTLRKQHGGGVPGVGVRRLTPTECARLQGFPDHWNDCQTDTARYAQFGNAVTVPVAEWIGRRIVRASDA